MKSWHSTFKHRQILLWTCGFPQTLHRECTLAANIPTCEFCMCMQVDGAEEASDWAPPPAQQTGRLRFGPGASQRQAEVAPLPHTCILFLELLSLLRQPRCHSMAS